MEKMWDVRTTARYLGLSERTVYQMARDGRIPAIRVGGRWRFRPEEIESWLEPESGQRQRPRLAGGHGDPEGSLERLLAPFADPLERRLAFVAWLSEECIGRGWPAPVIVGGHAVEFYSAGGYATADIDLVTLSEPLDEILGKAGFDGRGRHWVSEDLGLVVEAPGSRLKPGQRERVTEVEVAGKVARVLAAEDVIVDRLAACVHWSTEDDCAWARVLLEAHRDRLDLGYLVERAREVEVEERLEDMLEEA